MRSKRVVKAVVKLQPTATGLDFVAKGTEAKSWAVAEYEVTAASWADLRHVLRTFDVLGAHRAKRGTVESYTEDIGALPARLRRLS